MRTSESTKAIDQAFIKAQRAFKIAHKEHFNPHFKSRYADFKSIIDASREALLEAGIGTLQPTQFLKDAGVWVVTTRLIHEGSSEWYESDYPLLAKDTSAQSMASAVTYAKRYGLSAILSLVISDEDDDGEAATGRGQPQDKPAVNRPHVVNTPPLVKPIELKAPAGSITEEEWKRIYGVIKTTLSLDRDGIHKFVLKHTGKTSPRGLTHADLATLENVVDQEKMTLFSNDEKIGL